LKLTKLTDIKYKEGNGPKELILDLDSFKCNKNVPVGPFNLNTKVGRAIKQVTGLDSVSCKFDSLSVSN